MKKLNIEEIYVIHLVEDVDRYAHLFRQLKDFDYKIWWTCKRPISKDIGDKIASFKTPYYKKHNTDYGAVFNCSFEWYTLVKTCYLRGLNSVCVFEDDVTFVQPVDNIIDIINNVPKDCDIFKIDKRLYPVHHTNTYIKHKNGDNLAGNCGVVFFRNGMKAYIDYMDAHFDVSDLPYKHLAVNIYSYDEYLVGHSKKSNIIC